MKKYLLIVAALIVTVSAVATASATADTTPEPGDCVTQEAYTETTGWILDSPGAEWYLVDEKTVVNEEAYDEVVEEGHWQRYSWTGGPHESDSPPPFPSDDWQPNVQGDPHGVGVEGAYFRSHGNSGNGDWFYLEQVEAVIVHHEAVTHQEFKFALDHAAVECPGVTTASVTAIQPSCENEGEYGLILGNEDEIDYLVEGTILPGETVSVTAVAKEGVELEGQDEFKITFDPFDAADCESTPPGDPDDPTDPSDPDDPQDPQDHLEPAGEKPAGGVSASSPDVDPAVTSTLTSNGGDLPLTL